MVMNYNEAYFEVGNGWTKLCTQMMDELNELDIGAEIYILQIKQKFGELTVYYQYETNPKLSPYDRTHEQISYEIDMIIDKYKRIAHNTCERCGSTVNVVTTNFYYIECICFDCLNSLIQKTKKGEQDEG